MSTDIFPEDTMSTALEVQDQTVTPMGLIAAALDKGIDPGKLYDLQERWENKTARKAFNEAMLACQKDMPLIARNKWNDQTKSHYANIQAVHDAIKPIYQEHGFTCSHDTEQSHLPNHYRCVVDVRHSGGHSERYAIDLPADGEGLKGNPNKTPIQAVCSTVTYGQRYLECRVFNVTIAADDKDGQKQVPTISEEQIIQLNELMEYKEVKLDDFLKAFHIEALNKLPCNKFRNAVDMLNRRPKGAK